MDRLFWGLFFVLLDYKVTVGTAVIEVLPDFVGFFLMMKGMESLSDRSRYFDRGRHWAFGLSIVSGILFGADLMNPDTMTKVWLWAAGLAVLAVTLVLLRGIGRGIGEMGHSTERLSTMWMILAVMMPLCHLVSWVPLVGSISNVASVVTAALFLAACYDTIRKSAE